MGEWKEPVEYESDNTYAQYDLVIYDNAIWECKANDTINRIPQEGTYWTQYYVKNSMVGYTDSITNRNALYIALQDIDTTDIDGDKVMMDLEKGQYFALNSVGSRIWEEIQSPVKISDVVNTLLSEYDVDRETCEKSVIEFIEGLNSAGLLSSN